MIPQRAVLVEQQDRPPRRPEPRPCARRLDLQERHQAVDLRLLGHQPGQDAAQAQRLLAQRRPHPVVAGRRRVALVEDQVDDFQHRGEAFREFGPARHLEGDVLVGQGPLGPHDALGDGRLRGQERPRDLVGRQPAQQAQRQRHAGFRR